ncbi:MAG: NAD-dependent epimerase/dehydratase family protein, partial [Bacillati bacterium ANGP1]
MKIFVAGGTGVLGRSTVRALVEAGHTVRATARGDAKAAAVRALGAEAGSEAVLRLTTKIPPLMKMARRGEWTETNKLRTVGARVLVDAAIFEQIPIYVHESVTFVYADGGDRLIGEDAQVDDGGTAVLRAALDGEREAARFSQSGRQGIVLRFGAFYGPDAPSTLEAVQLVRRRMLPLIGPGTHYVSSIYVSDAARAVAAALGLRAGVYNVCDDRPVL